MIKMSEVKEKSIFESIREMREVDKFEVLEGCLSNIDNLNDVMTSCYGLEDWFDVYVSSDKFASLPLETRTKAVERFRDFYSFVDILNLRITAQYHKSNS